MSKHYIFLENVILWVQLCGAAQQIKVNENAIFGKSAHAAGTTSLARHLLLSLSGSTSQHGTSKPRS